MQEQGNHAKVFNEGRHNHFLSVFCLCETFHRLLQATRATIDSDRLTVERLVATTTAPSTTTGEATVTIAHISTTIPRATSQVNSVDSTI